MAITAEVVINFHAGSAAVSSVTANNSTSNASGTIFSDLVDVNGAATGCSFSSPHTRVCDTGGRAGTGSTLDQEINTNIAYFDVSGSAVHTYTVQLTASHPAVDVYVYSATSYSGQQALSIDVNGTTVTNHDASNQLGGNGSAAPVYFPSVTPNGSDQIVITIDNTNQFAAFNGLRIVPTGPAASAEQEGFRFGADDGSESAHTWLDAQDTNVTQPVGTAVLIRNLINGTGDLASAAYTLRYQKNGTGGYVAVPVGATVPEAYGTVTFGGIGTGANGSTTVAPRPASPPAGAYMLAVITSGATNSETPTAPDGTWTLLATGASTDGTYGVDTGPRRVTVFGKTASGSEGTTAITFSITNGGTCRGTISHFTKAGSGAWDVQAFGANDSTSGTGVSMTFSSMNWNTGDAVLVATGQRVDTATQSAQSLTATGVTFGTRTNRAATAVTTGNDHRHTVDTFAAISSTSDVDAAPTWAYTASAAASAGGVIVRLREYTAPVTNEVYIATSANIAAGGEATTARLTAPSGKSTSDFVTGRRWDDENGTDTIDITADDYTEVEWSVNTQAPAANGDYFEFRVYAGATALGTYTTTGRLTLGAGGATVNGQTLTVTASLIPGSAVGDGNASVAGQTLTATASLVPGSATGSTLFSDDFEAGGGTGSLDGWTIFQPANGPSPSRIGGRYDSGSITTVGSTTWFNGDRGVAVWKLVPFPTSGQPDKEIIFYNVGVGPTGSPTSELTFVDASHYALAGAVVHDSNTSNINYEFLVVGHRGADGQYTLETKTTTGGSSQVSDVGDNAVGSGVTHADIRLLMRDDNTLRWYYRPPGGTTWTAINTTGTPGVSHGGGYTFSSGSAYVGFVAYAFSAVPTAFRGVADEIELVGEVAPTVEGQTLTATASLIPGTATGTSNTTVAGQTLTATASVIPGSAAGSSNATVTGQTLTATASLVPGTATGTSNATVAGQTLTATASLVPGGTTADSAAAGQTLTAVASLIAGTASGGGSATVAGQTLTATASLLAGAGEADSSAAGQTLTATASLIAGTATGEINATVAGQTLTATASLIAGAASGSQHATVEGQVLTVTTTVTFGGAYGPSVGGAYPAMRVSISVSLGL